MAVHYVCNECGGVSDHAGVCETGGCYLCGKPLRECHCTDGKHGVPEEIEIKGIGEEDSNKINLRGLTRR